MGGQSTATVPRGRPRAAAWGAVALASGTIAVAGVVIWVFLSLYASRHYASPIAQDTLKYIWRTRLTEVNGFRAVGSVPAGTSVEPDRPGLPALAALVHSVLGVTPFRFVFVLAPVAAVLIGFGAAALMVCAAGEPGWSFPIYVLAVGASVNVALMAVGYLDNLLATVVLLGAATAGLLAADGRRGVVATGLLLVGAAAIHWQFAALFLAIMGGLVVLLLPESFLAWRRGRRLRETPAVRLGAGLLGGAAGGGLLLLADPGQLPRVNRGSFLNKLDATEGAYRFGVAGPAAAAGVVVVAVPPRARRLRALALLLVWGTSALVAYLALRSGRALPAHRFVAFALAIPILAAASVIGAARGLGWLAGRVRGRGAAAARVAAAVLGGALVLGAVVASTAVARDEWYGRAHPVLDVRGYPGYAPTEARAIAEAGRAGAYVERDGRGLPVVYVVQAGDMAQAASAFGIIRTAIPTEQIPRTAVYVGTVENLLAGRPTRSPQGNRQFDYVSLKFWAGSRDLAARAIVIELRSFDPRLVLAPPGGRPDPGGWIARGVWLVRGPNPAALIPDVEPPVAPSALGLAVTALGVLALVAAAGSGWSAWLLDDGPARVALAPAFGVVVLCLAGVVVDRAGPHLHGAVGVATVVVVTALGWAWLPVSRWRGRKEAEQPPPAGDGTD